MPLPCNLGFQGCQDNSSLHHELYVFFYFPHEPIHTKEKRDRHTHTKKTETQQNKRKHDNDSARPVHRAISRG